MEHRAIVEIDSDLLDQIHRYLTVEPATRDEALDEDDTIIVTARFDDGIEMDIKCCGVQWHDYDDEELESGETNTAWCEAVLFCDGPEVGQTMGEIEFDGEWEIDYAGDTYIAEVVGV